MIDKIKVVVHVHTWASADSLSAPSSIVDYCRRNGIGAIAITDHNEIWGAEEVSELSNGNPLVIIGEEIASRDGEVIGLFLSRKIEKGLELEDTIAEIRKQGGIVYLPHPGETFRKTAIKKNRVLEVMPEVDILEVHNSRTVMQSDNRWAYNLAIKHNKGMLVGCDAHFVKDISRAVNYLQQFSDKDSFLKSVATSSVETAVLQSTGLGVQLFSKFVKIAKKRVKRLRREPNRQSLLEVSENQQRRIDS
ncbi:MAG: putative hydrolase [bacterium ADurb.Bin400]|nr:MAG: putative hydrolase [bacterium ADurb.Bin400]